ncbi:MAG TPA: polysaccharide deacetylase family protein [Clostridia bacterium]|nr:polysaccharide deacetylase family protein [Clostridia bacterium]
MSTITPIKSRIKDNYIAIAAGLIAALILMGTSIYLLVTSYQVDKFAQEKGDKFSSYFKNGKYEKALAFYKDSNTSLKGTKKEKTVKKLNSLIADYFDNTSEKLLSGKKDSKVTSEIKGLLLFKKEVSDELTLEMERVYNLYLSKQISYEKASQYFKGLEAYSFASEEIKKSGRKVDLLSDSRKSLKNAKKLLASKDYSGAIAEFKKVTKTDPKDYKAAKTGKRTCLKAMYPLYLENAQNYIKQYQFRAACRLLTEALQYYPNNKVIKQRLAEYTAEEKKADSQLVDYNGIVEHIFFHPLIAYPELAFDNDYMSAGYNDWFVTVGEFKKIIQSLYDNNYILIDINSLYEVSTENGKEVFKRAQLKLPKNKKPIIISVDDINYYEYMIENGDVYKLVLDKDGNVATYSKTPKGEEVISRDNEIIPILDKFVEEHPDFSFRGAKGTLALTGYEGILGYRTQNLTATGFENDKAEALKIVKRLKETGWTFASHSYGHPAMGKISYEKCVKDTNNWKNEVESLIGPTKIYIYPYGSRVKEKMDDPKFKYLYNAGFRVFCGVGARPYEKDTSNFILMDRRNVDGYSLNYRRDTYLPLYDSNLVIDRSVRPAFKPLN